MEDKEYWRRRSEKYLEDLENQCKAEIEPALAKYFKDSLKEIEKEIILLYGKYARGEFMRYTDAKKFLRGRDFSEWRMSLREYVEASHTDSKILHELNTLAMRSRITRLEKLYTETLKQVQNLGEFYDEKIKDFLTSSYKERYSHGLFDLAKVGKLSIPVAKVQPENLEKVLSMRWEGGNFSSRVWENTEKLSAVLKNTLAQGLHRGLSVQKLSASLSREMDASYKAAERLVRTELNFVSNYAAKDSLEAAGLEEYEFIAVLDHRTTPRCQELDGTIHLLSEYSPGTNAPPMHPRCRSTISKVISGSKRTARDSNGKNIKVPADWTYEKWQKSVESGRIQKGALNDENDPTGKRRDKHAEMYYETRRNSKKEPFVKRIAENSGMRIAAVSKIFDHVFTEKHELWDGYQTFPPDYYMAESFRRLSEGRGIEKHDLIMLKHEWLELGLMKRYGYDYDTAHRITERKYNYKKALIEWHKRKGIKWSG